MGFLWPSSAGAGGQRRAHLEAGSAGPPRGLSGAQVTAHADLGGFSRTCCRCTLWVFGWLGHWQPRRGRRAAVPCRGVGSPPGDTGGHAPEKLHLVPSCWPRPAPTAPGVAHLSPVFAPVPSEAGFTVRVLCKCCSVACWPLSVGLSEPTRLDTLCCPGSLEWDPLGGGGTVKTAVPAPCRGSQGEPGLSVRAFTSRCQ